MFSAFGVTYNSVAECSKALHLSETTIRRRLQKKNNTHFVHMERVDHGYKKIMVEGVLYDSIVSAWEAGVANNRQTIMRRLKNPNFPNWYYLEGEG